MKSKLPLSAHRKVEDILSSYGIEFDHKSDFLLKINEKAEAKAEIIFVLIKDFKLTTNEVPFCLNLKVDFIKKSYNNSIITYNEKIRREEDKLRPINKDGSIRKKRKPLPVKKAKQPVIDLPKEKEKVDDNLEKFAESVKFINKAGLTIGDISNNLKRAVGYLDNNLIPTTEQIKNIPVLNPIELMINKELKNQLKGDKTGNTSFTNILIEELDKLTKEKNKLEYRIEAIKNLISLYK